MKRITLCLSLFMALATGAMAGIKGVMTSAELEDEIFGVYMKGVAGVSDMPWSECIEPDGTTVYTYQGVQIFGKMIVLPNDQACFDYGYGDETRRNCFRVYRNGKTYTFSGGARNGGEFRVTEIKRNIVSCTAETDLLG